MKTLKNEDGMILLTVLMLMFIATLLGVISINSSTIEVQISGNEKRVSTVFAAAEAGIDFAIPIIEQSLIAGTLYPSSFTVKDKKGTYRPVHMDTENSQLYKEIADPASANDPDTTDSAVPDLLIPDIGSGVEVSIDIDRLYSEVIAGGALEFAMGYEGVGAGAAGGGVAVYYHITSAGKI
ncbi:MAG: pilus assembly PilX N-terminal domain-containing protein [bacterium]|nr:pilus assembly PilX N-terminal domain-containing protein [bacterium]